MKTIYKLIAGLAIAVPFCAVAWATETGQVAPAFELAGRSGPVKLSDYRGQTVYLDFWASWCGPCKQSFPWMNEMASRYRNKGLRVVAINVDQRPTDAQEFLKDNPANFDIAFDQAGSTPKAFGIKGMPTSYLLGPDGRVLALHTGFKAEQKAELEKQIRQALAIKD